MNDKDYRTVVKMVERCEKIAAILEKFECDFDAFLTDVAFQDACCMNVIQLGELVGRLSEALKARRSDVPWTAIRGLRNLFAHDYEAANEQMVWQTITRDVPALRGVLLEILAEN